MHLARFINFMVDRVHSGRSMKAGRYRKRGIDTAASLLVEFYNLNFRVETRPQCVGGPALLKPLRSIRRVSIWAAEAPLIINLGLLS